MSTVRQKHNTNGFVLIEVLIFIAVVLVISATTFFIIKHVGSKNTANNCDNNHPLRVTTSGVQNDIVIDCPINNSTVSPMFNISGTAKYSNNNEAAQAMSVDFNGNQFNSAGDDTYLSKVKTLSFVPSGKYVLSLDLTGNNALTTQTPVQGGEKYTYDSLKPGKYTFTVIISSYCKNGCNLISEDQSAPLTLYIK